MILSLILFLIYIIGVFLALFMIAWLNVKHDYDYIPEFSLLSWIFVIVTIFIIVTSPLYNLYCWLCNKLENTNKNKYKNNQNKWEDKKNLSKD